MNNHLIEQDKQQRQLALDASKSFIVQAPAGSGKTELLIQRFLTLLKIVNTPEEILAITFTKKAANEMRSRVIKALKQGNEAEPTSAHAKQTWLLARDVLKRDAQFNWHLIDNPNQLRIQTIDSLCSYLTKQLPLLSHFGSQPDIAENPMVLYRSAVHDVLLHVEEDLDWSEAISQLLLHLDNDFNKVHELLVNLLAKRDQWLPYLKLGENTAEIKRQLESHLANVIQDNLQRLVDLFPKELAPELASILRYAADNLAITKPDAPILVCRNLTTIPTANAEDKSLWQAIAHFLQTDKGEWRKSFTVANGIPAPSSFKNAQEKSNAAFHKERALALIARLYDHEDFRVALSELDYLPNPYYQPEQWKILQSLLYVLKVVAAQLRVTFQLYGQIDFIENAQAALEALGRDDTPTDLALALDYNIKHILVDEFQDTALTQYQLLEKLITGWDDLDGRTLFVVGDPMQSIYRFREAEVGLFIRMRSQGIGNIKLIPLTLSVNFRSAEKIVEWNNAHFQHIFPPFNDMATGAVTYSPSVTHSSQINDPHAVVSVQGFLESESAQPNKIVELILQTQREYPHEKIAILVRSRPHLKDIIPALKKAQISYRAVDIDPLASRQTIHDLLSLTCALLHPADRISWLAILRAPWCGLTLADLLVIAGENPYATIWEQLIRDDINAKLSSDGLIRVHRFMQIMKDKVAVRERYDLRSWVESTWMLLGGPACLQDYSEMDDVNAYLKLLDNFGKNDPALNLDKLKEKINELYAAAHQHEASVQIMTVHSAKGLEFDTVILPHLENKPANDSHSLLLWMEQPLANKNIALLLAPIHATGDEKDGIYEYVTHQQRIKSNYEIDRLLYVATTRAKKRLHLFFNADANESNEIRVESGSFLKKLWPLLEKKQHELIVRPEENAQLTNDYQSPLRKIKRLTSAWKNPIEEMPRPNVAFHQTKSGFQLTDQQPRVIGIVIHRILQQISECGIAWWELRSAHEHETFVGRELRQEGILPADLPKTTIIVLRSISNTLKDERGAWILQAHAEAKSEFAISAMMNNEMHHLIIDRTFVDNDSVRWIIDYKTSTFTHDDLNHFLQNEEKKYAEKMRKYANAIGLMDSRPIKLGLYFPALPAWKVIE